MRTRVYCLLPDAASARATMDDLLLAGIELRRMHCVGPEDCDLSGLHAANVLQTSDLLRSAEAGLVAGAAAGGLLGAIAAVGYPDAGEAPQWSFIPILVFAGAIFDGWTASMFGISAPNRQLQRFTADIAQGRIVLMIDVPTRRLGEIEARLQALPAASLQGAQARVAAFP